MLAHGNSGLAERRTTAREAAREGRCRAIRCRVVGDSAADRDGGPLPHTTPPSPSYFTAALFRLLTPEWLRLLHPDTPPPLSELQDLSRGTRGAARVPPRPISRRARHHTSAGVINSHSSRLRPASCI